MNEDKYTYRNTVVYMVTRHGDLLKVAQADSESLARKIAQLLSDAEGSAE